MKDLLASLPAIVSRLDGNSNTVEPLVFAAWKRSVDGALAEHIVPIGFDKDKLVAAVSSETWRRQVADLGPTLVDRLNKTIGSPLVKFVEFRIDAAAVREHRRRLKPVETPDLESAIEAALTPGIKDAADSISDESLRNRFLAAAGSTLARQDR